MEEINDNKIKGKQSVTPIPIPQVQQNPIIQLAQAINSLSGRMSKSEIEIIKIKADIEISEKDRNLLSKRLDFAFDKIDNLED